MSAIDDSLTEQLTDTAKENETASNSELTPGQILRQGREANNWPIEEISERLYLDIRIIKIIENDEYDSLPAAIFAQGYIRSYARLLELPVEEIVDNYRRTLEKDPPKLKGTHVQERKQVTSHNPWFKLSSAIIVIILVILAVWAWKQTLGPNEIIDTSLEEPLLLSEPEITENITEFNPPSEGINAETTTENNENATTENNSENLTTENTDENQENSNVVETVIEPVVTELDKNTLELNTETRAWISIKDDDGKKLYRQTTKAGDKIVLTGKPPFKISLGRTSGVSITYMGKPIKINKTQFDVGKAE
jgi:cytoskeleton protein RodZ